MQNAIPYRSWVRPPIGRTPRHDHHQPPLDPPCDAAATTTAEKTKIAVNNKLSKNTVIVFGKAGCCMCHVINTLFLGHGVNPAVFEVDEEEEGIVVEELMRIMRVNKEGKEDAVGIGSDFQFPLVFVGGKLFGGLDKVMASHISGELVPTLRGAGALWL